MNHLSATAYQRHRHRPARLPWTARQINRPAGRATAQQMTGKVVIHGHAGAALSHLNMADHATRLEIAQFLKLAIGQGWIDSDLVKRALTDADMVAAVLAMAAGGMTHALNQITAAWRDAEWCQWDGESVEYLTFAVTASARGLDWVVAKECGVTLYQVAINMAAPDPLDDLYAMLVFWLRHKANGSFAHEWIADPELVDTIQAMSPSARAALLHIETDDDVAAFSKRYSKATNTLADVGYDLADNRGHIHAACSAILYRQLPLFKLVEGMAPPALFTLLRQQADALSDAIKGSTKGRLLLAMIECWHTELVSCPPLQALSTTGLGLRDEDEDEPEWRLDSAVVILLDTELDEDTSDALNQHHEHLMSAGGEIRERLSPSLDGWHAIQAAALAEYQLGALCRWLNQG